MRIWMYAIKSAGDNVIFLLTLSSCPGHSLLTRRQNTIHPNGHMSRLTHPNVERVCEELSGGCGAFAALSE